MFPSDASPTQALHPATHIRICDKMLKDAGVVSDHKSHVTRGCASRIAELKGISEDQIRRLGHWQAGAMERHYLSALPRQGMRGMAGCRSLEPGRYFLKRSLTTPSDELQRQIFPQLEDWMERHERGQDIEQSLSCKGFLNLLKYLRVVVLQDAVVLQQEHPSLFIWQHPLFLSDEFLAFKQEQLRNISSAVDPLAISLEELLPEVANEIRQNRLSINRLNQTVDQLASLQRLSQENSSSEFQRLQTVFSTVLRAISDPISIPLPPQEPLPLSTNLTPTVLPSIRVKMKRDVNMTVAQLWQEWTVGIDGGPSIRELERATNRTWRTCDKTESRYFQRRFLIIDAIQKLIDSGMPEAEAVARLESQRGSRPLHKLYRELQSQSPVNESDNN